MIALVSYSVGGYIYFLLLMKAVFMATFPLVTVSQKYSNKYINWGALVAQLGPESFLF